MIMPNEYVYRLFFVAVTINEFNALAANQEDQFIADIIRHLEAA